MTIKTDILENMLTSEAMKNFVNTYNTATSIVLSLATIAVMIMIVFNITKLARSADNPGERQRVITSLAVCLLCFSVLGGIDTLYALIVNFVTRR